MTKDLLIMIFAFQFLVMLSCLGDGAQSRNYDTNGQEEIQSTMKGQQFNIAEYEERKEAGSTEFTLDDGTVVKQSDVGKGVDKNYIEHRIPPPPALFQEFRRFHSDGTLKLEGHRFHSGLQYGVWKEYDERGVKIKETDHEAPFGFGFEALVVKVREYHKENDIQEVDLLDKNTTISRENGGNGKYWFFSWESVPGRMDVLKIDGDSGELIETSHYELMDN